MLKSFILKTAQYIKTYSRLELLHQFSLSSYYRGIKELQHNTALEQFDVLDEIGAVLQLLLRGSELQAFSSS